MVAGQYTDYRTVEMLQIIHDNGGLQFLPVQYSIRVVILSWINDFRICHLYNVAENHFPGLHKILIMIGILDVNRILQINMFLRVVFDKTKWCMFLHLWQQLLSQAKKIYFWRVQMLLYISPLTVCVIMLHGRIHYMIIHFPLGF